MEGIYVADRSTDIDRRRPRTKKEIREILADTDGPGRVWVEWTSLFHRGPSTERVADLPVGTAVSFVGPNPHTDRRFYGTLTVVHRGDGKAVVVK